MGQVALLQREVETIMRLVDERDHILSCLLPYLSIPLPFKHPIF